MPVTKRLAKSLIARGAARWVARGESIPSTVEMETLESFRVPPNCRKLVHRWRDGRRLPDVRELT